MSGRLEAALAELAAAIREEVAEAARPDGPQLLSVEDAAQLAGIGRTALYSLIANGRVRSVSLGRRRLVPRAAIAELAQSPPEVAR